MTPPFPHALLPHATLLLLLLLGLSAPLSPVWGQEEGGGGGGGALESELYAQFVAQMPWSGAKVEAFDLKVKGRKITDWEQATLMPGSWRGGVMRAKVTLGGGRHRWVQVRYTVQVPVWQVNCPVAPGALVAPCTSQGWASPQRAYRDLWPGDETLGPELVASRGLRVGEVMRRSMAKAPVWVERGQMVELEVQRGAVVIRARGAALEQGRAHEVIRVKSGATGKVVEAVVRAPGKVDVL